MDRMAEKALDLGLVISEEVRYSSSAASLFIVSTDTRSRGMIVGKLHQQVVKKQHELNPQPPHILNDA